MFFNKFPTSDGSDVTVVTLAANCREMGVFSAMNLFAEQANMEHGDIFGWIFSPSLKNELITLLHKIDDEFSQPDSYAPYLKDLGLAPTLACPEALFNAKVAGYVIRSKGAIFAPLVFSTSDPYDYTTDVRVRPKKYLSRLNRLRMEAGEDVSDAWVDVSRGNHPRPWIRMLLADDCEIPDFIEENFSEFLSKIGEVRPGTVGDFLVTHRDKLQKIN
ncbi:Hypothetical predicted protein [Cloeon dipterum]|uniref:Rhabdovirus nucleocapsid domain-containing protein n=2 Tax=Cloeon dipterum TaxID=197152 RepID=A0A8S1EDJ3_9INSE|nr:Hypothetical predicted protein [Cloeon dipterum]